MPVKLEDRPIEDVREETIDKLIVNYGHGVISAEAFERRLDEATAATEHQTLIDLAADLTIETDSNNDRYKDKQFSPHYQSRTADAEDEQRIVSVLSSNESSGQWLVPKKITIFALLGSAELDFTDAIFQHQQVTIKVINILSYLEILVPEHVNVTSKTINILSSTENNVASMGGRQAPTISVEGYSVISSIEFSIKQTIKEKFIAFANRVKLAFNTSDSKN